MPSLSVDSPLSTSTVSPASSIDALPRKSNDKTFGVYAITKGTAPDSATSEHRKSPLKPVKNNSLHSLTNGLPGGDLRNGLDHSQVKSATTNSAGNGLAGYVENRGHGVEQNGGALKADSTEDGEDNKTNGVVEEL